jgi:hypothetical protein
MEYRLEPEKLSSNCDVFPQSYYSRAGVCQTTDRLQASMTFTDKTKIQGLLWVAQMTSFVSAQDQTRDLLHENNIHCWFKEIKGHNL